MSLPFHRSPLTSVWLTVFATSFAAFAQTGSTISPSSDAHPVRHLNDYTLVNSSTVTLKGVLRPATRSATDSASVAKPWTAACEFTLKLKPGERSVEARGIPGSSPIVNDDGTCEVTVQLGQIPEAAIPIRYNSVPPAPNLTARPEDITPSPGTSSGYMQGYYTDPVGIWVNSEQTNISWIWTGSPIGCSSIYSYSDGVPSSFPGWYMVSKLPYVISYCQADPTTGFTTTASGYGLYVNWEDDSFPGCLGSPANAYYEPIYAYGDNYGTLYGNFAWALTGPGAGCIDLLTPHYNLIRTYN
jgi:hypothetical protein